MLLLVVALLLSPPVRADAVTDIPARDRAEPWQADIERFAQADRAQPPARGAIVFIGSSSIRLWETPARDCPGVAVVNRGFGGSIIADSTRLADRILVPLAPRAIVFYAGDNDLAAGHTPRQVRDDFEGFVRTVRERLPRVPIAYVSIKPSPARVALLERMREANALVREYAARQHAIAYVDVMAPMLDAQGQPRPDLFGPDRLHMNRAGYALWIPLVRAALPR
jgi:lysophospholipase L1-like esterase